MPCIERYAGRLAAFFAASALAFTDLGYAGEPVPVASLAPLAVADERSQARKYSAKTPATPAFGVKMRNPRAPGGWGDELIPDGQARYPAANTVPSAEPSSTGRRIMWRQIQ